jgi:hypothetical protein
VARSGQELSDCSRVAIMPMNSTGMGNSLKLWNRSWQTREKQLGHAIRFFEVRVPRENEGVDPSAAYS